MKKTTLLSAFAFALLLSLSSCGNQNEFTPYELGSGDAGATDEQIEYNRTHQGVDGGVAGVSFGSPSNKMLPGQAEAEAQKKAEAEKQEKKEGSVFGGVFSKITTKPTPTEKDLEDLQDRLAQEAKGLVEVTCNDQAPGTPLEAFISESKNQRELPECFVNNKFKDPIKVEVLADFFEKIPAIKIGEKSIATQGRESFSKYFYDDEAIRLVGQNDKFGEDKGQLVIYVERQNIYEDAYNTAKGSALREIDKKYQELAMAVMADVRAGLISQSDFKAKDASLTAERNKEIQEMQKSMKEEYNAQLEALIGFSAPKDEKADYQAQVLFDKMVKAYFAGYSAVSLPFTVQFKHADGTFDQSWKKNDPIGHTVGCSQYQISDNRCNDAKK